MIDTGNMPRLGIGLEDLGDMEGTLLMLRSGKYIGYWASGDLKPDKITDLRRDLEW